MSPSSDCWTLADSCLPLSLHGEQPCRGLLGWREGCEKAQELERQVWESELQVPTPTPSHCVSWASYFLPRIPCLPIHNTGPPLPHRHVGILGDDEHQVVGLAEAKHPLFVSASIVAVIYSCESNCDGFLTHSFAPFLPHLFFFFLYFLI